jgi:hypothetical protein
MELSTVTKYHTFLDVWYKVVLNQVKPTNYSFQTIPQLKNLLYNSYQSKLGEIIQNRFSGLDYNLSKAKFISDIVVQLGRYPVHDHGFYPSGINKYQGLTCAGSASLVSYLLYIKGIYHYYARPVGHSVNIIVEEGNIYWLDAHNGVYEKVLAQIQMDSGVRYITINPDNKIDYRLAILLNPKYTYYQIFGNFENLKRNSISDFNNVDQELIKSINFIAIRDELFPNIRRFMKQSTLYKNEVKRMKGVNSNR